MRRPLQISLSLVLAFLLAPSLLAATITGTVTNGTNNKPSAGDDVILISLQQRMQEAARTTTDAHGKYSITVPDQGMHLIRVDHQKASYFQPAPPNTTTVDVTVFDVAATVPGITTEANVIRVETDPQGLHVTQSYFVKNDSTPPRTQFSSHSYEIYLPPDAKVEGAAAMGPGGMPVASSPAPMGEKGHYAYLFPLRPGETQFQVTYSLPYSGSAKFTPRLADKADNVVVMVPKSMTFTPDPSTPYQPLNDDINAQTFVAKSVSPTAALGFSVSGSGALPRDVQTAQGGNGQPGAAAGADDNRPGGGLGTPIDTPDPLSKYKWWILSAVGLLLVIAAAFFLRRPAQRDVEIAAAPAEEATAEQYAAPLTWTQSSPPPSAVAPIPPPPPPPAEPDSEAHTRALLNSLKEELFALESDRAKGNVGEVEYAAHKQALEAIIRRALNR
ncbi:MAG TPA: carboxypeptidase-like regulatory domain-containing protein [Acidobacteriaceae bacterium]|jgi:hypothetical protein